MTSARYAASLALLMLWNASADARSLETVLERGALTLCASPNALPFASKSGPVPEFQIELGEKIAEQLGVKLTREWVISAIQYRRADCDLVLDVIARKDTPPAGGAGITPLPSQRRRARGAGRFVRLVAGQPRLRSTRRSTGRLAGLHDARQGRHRHLSVRIRDIVAALANREIEAAAVTPMTVGWFNLHHVDKPLRLISAFDSDQDLNWNIAAGLLRPDDRLQARVDAAIEALLADGTIARIYARYGITLRPPQ